MSLRKAFALNKNAEQDGVEFKFYEAENEDNTVPTFILARAGGSNERYKSTVLKYAPKGYMSPEAQRKLMIDVYARTVVKSWSDVYDEDDNGNTVKIPFTVQNCIDLMTKYALLYERIAEFANDATNYLIKQLDETAKN